MCWDFSGAPWVIKISSDGAWCSEAGFTETHKARSHRPEHLLLRCYREGPSRWWRSKTWRSTSSPQKHQKYRYMWKITEHLLNAERRPETSQKARHSPRTWLCGWQGLGAPARCQAWGSEVGELSSRHWTTRDLPAPCNINQRKLSQRSLSQS